MQIEVGAIVEGKVTGIANFGAFVALDDGKKTGLVHISEIASEYVSDIHTHLKTGQTVKVKVIGMENGKISLSIKQAKPEGETEKKENRARGRHARTKEPAEKGMKNPPEEFEFIRRKNPADMSFDDMLQKFKQDSDEKFQDLKRSNEGKRSGGYKRAY